VNRRSLTSLAAVVSLGLVLALGQPSSAVVPPSTPAVAAGSWVGTATNPDGTFNYGAVRFTVRGATVVSLGLVLALGQPSSAVVPPSTPAVAAGSWVGTATNPDGTFNYGAGPLHGSRPETMARLAPTKGHCAQLRHRGGDDRLRVHVARHGLHEDQGQSVRHAEQGLKGAAGARVSASYQPVKDIDQIIVVNATTGSRQGADSHRDLQFGAMSFPAGCCRSSATAGLALCGAEGAFSARAR
jgi:hypothetical protein